MKNIELIQKLQQYPEDMDVCVIDLRESLEQASEEASTVGVYHEFEIGMGVSEEQFQELKEDFPDAINFIAIAYLKDEETKL